MATDDPQPDVETDAATDPPEQDDTNTNAEAAKWRVKYRSVTKERDELKTSRDDLQAKHDGLTATIDQIRRDQVSAFAVASGIRGEAVFAVAELDDLLTEAGTVDEKKVNEAIDHARRTLGIDTPRKPIGSLKSGATGKPTGGEPVDAWRT